MLAIMMSPATTPVGLLTVTVAELLIAVVAVPRCAICEYTTLPLSANASNNIALEIIVDQKDVGRNVPMSIKRLVFSYKLVAKILKQIDTKQSLIIN